MGSRGGKKKAVSYDRNARAAEREKERKKRERKLWLQLHKKALIIGMCVILALCKRNLL